MRFLQIRSACGWMFDCCCGHFGSQRGSFQRNRHGSAICKKRSQKCGVATGFFQIFVFLLFLSNTCKPTYKSESVYTNHCIMFPLHLVFNLLLKILHDLLWLIIFPIRNHKIKDHIRMCWPFDHSKVMN